MGIEKKLKFATTSELTNLSVLHMVAGRFIARRILVVVFNKKRYGLETLENIELHFCQVARYDEWGQAVCFAAGEMGFMCSSLPLSKRNEAKEYISLAKKTTGTSR